MNKNDAIDNFIDCLNIDEVAAWADIFDIDRELPPLDDMYPDWESELRTKIGDAMHKVGE